MVEDRNDTELVIDERIDFPDSGRMASITVRFIPSSNAYPEGVKSRMHYGTDDCTTILRYDNSHGKAKGHERHSDDRTEIIELPGWEALLERFRNEMMEYGQQHD